MPLAVCDTASVSREDCLEVDVVKAGGYNGELSQVHYNQNQQYFYLSKQRPNEPLLLSMALWDPEDPDRYTQGGWFSQFLNVKWLTINEGVPHVSFPLPQCDQCPHAPRESIEVKTLVLVPRKSE